MVFGVGLSQAKSKKAAVDSSAEEERNFLAEEAAESLSALNVESNLDTEAAEAAKGGSF